ncbi:MAG: ATP-binding protein [Clostridiales bacterium]|nr:ATP-binding protein [Clostridiales bacterium]
MSKFKTKARAIELLGRKQIRDSVTALAELMKNSYDADADWVRVYFNSNQDNIILIDNGDGMDKEDIEGKWLVLGTPSKNTKNRVSNKGRPYMGAKGIGRLASARLSKQYLMITKTILGNYNIVYLYWDLFEDTSIALEDLEIPTYYDVSGKELVSNFNSIIDELINTQLRNVEKYAQSTFNPIVKEIYVENICMLKPKANEILNYLPLIEKKGTMLFMCNLRDDWNSILIQSDISINDDLSAEKNYKRLSNFVATLNSAYKKYEGSNNDFVEVFKNNEVLYFHEDYDENDFNIYDIKFEGTIQAGIFCGQLFARNSNDTVLQKANAVLANGIDVSAGIKDLKNSDCGPIRVKICHIEGIQENSALPKEIYERIHEKIDVLGGIGIYRDGVKVLPYGEPENDYLEIEKRRTIKAGVYVFSHRNIFGRIDITSKENPQLEDKSSREGFIENEQYQYFILTLKNLLIKIALDFLSSARKDSFNIRTYMVEHYNKLKEENKTKKAYEKQEREKYRNLIKNIQSCLSQKKDFSAEIADLINEVERLGKELSDLHDEQLLDRFDFLYDKAQAFRYKLEQIRDKYIMRIPERYISDIAQNDNKIFIRVNSFNNEVDELYREAENILITVLTLGRRKEKEYNKVLIEKTEHETKLAILISRLDNLKSTILELYNDFINKQKNLKSDVESEVKQLNQLINPDFDLEEYFHVIDDFKNNVKLDASATHKTYQYEDLSKTISDFCEEKLNDFDNFYKQFNDSLQQKSFIVHKIKEILESNDYASHDDKIIGMLKAENLLLKDEVDLYEDLANFGMASEILNHEFNQFYTKANDAIVQLNAYLADKDSRYWLKQIQIAFDAIYSRHTLLSPMYKIKTDEIKSYNLKDIVDGTVKLFTPTLNRENISLSVNVNEDIFVNILPSHFYPALSNIISNAIFWTVGAPQKKIYIHYVEEENALYIEDNGKGILAENKSDIFKPFYSLKPNGRGLGLTISKRVLEKDGHSIDIVEISKYRVLHGACFKIVFGNRG